MAIADEEMKALRQSLQQQQEKANELNRRSNKLRIEADNLDAEARGVNNAIDGFSMALRRLEEEAKRKAEVIPQ